MAHQHPKLILLFGEYATTRVGVGKRAAPEGDQAGLLEAAERRLAYRGEGNAEQLSGSSGLNEVGYSAESYSWPLEGKEGRFD